MSMPDGFAYVEGRSREKAAEWLALADEHNVDRTLIQSTRGGYFVPDYLLDRIEKARKAAKKPASKKGAGKTEAADAPEEKE